MKTGRAIGGPILMLLAVLAMTVGRAVSHG
jgi:hypothetical protein